MAYNFPFCSPFSKYRRANLNQYYCGNPGIKSNYLNNFNYQNTSNKLNSLNTPNRLNNYIKSNGSNNLISSRKTNNSCNLNNLKTFNNSCSSNNNNNNCLFNKESSKDFSDDQKLFEIFGIKLHYDDILLISLIFFLYNEGVKDQYLFISLILLLLS